MKRKRLMSAVAAATLFSVSLVSPSVFAANPYGIEYTGGEELGENNLIEAPELIDSLKLVVPYVETGEVKSKFVFDNPSAYKKGYYNSSTNGCTEVNYFTFKKDGIKDASDYSFTLSYGRYSQQVKLNEIKIGDEIEGSSVTPDKDSLFAMTVSPKAFMQMYETIYTDSECTKKLENLYERGAGDVLPFYVFVDTTSTIIDNETGEAAEAGDLYYFISDIDARQSYKIMNEDSKLNPENMYVKAFSDVQPESSSVTARNRYVGLNKNYIYSEPGVSIDYTNEKGSHVYVKLGESAQQDGVNMIFGFAKYAGSGIRYYAKMINVTYKSDENGEVSGIDAERLISGANPAGSETTPKEGFDLYYWTADKDVVLKNGTKIKKDEHLSAEQVKQVVAKEDVEFTAHHDTKMVSVLYESDKNGKITGKTDEVLKYKQNPTGSKSTPAEDYEFKNWVADKDVTLKDGKTVIKKGKELTDAQVKQVVVTEDIVFTAIHEKVEAKAPNGGMFTGEADSNTIGIIAPIATAAAIALGGIALHEIKARKAVRRF